MSRVDLKEFLQAYLGELSELLAAANALLLSVDAAQRRDEPTPKQVRELFRAMHTVKGLSAMVGVDPIVALAHRIESLLRRADRAGGRLPAGAVDLILRGVGAIEQRARALADGREVPAAPSPLLDAMDALDESVAPSARTVELRFALDPAFEGKLGPVERESLERGVRGGRRAIGARFAPSPERAAQGININSVRQRLGTVAEIVKVVPISVRTTPEAPAGLAFAILALTNERDEALARTVLLDELTTVAEPAPPSRPPEPAPEALGTDEATQDVEAPSPAGASFVRVEVARLDDALEQLSGLIVGRAVLAREVAKMGERGVDVRGLLTILRDEGRQVRDLRTAILRVRMIPVSEVLERVPLIVRAVKRETGKQARLEIDSGRAELDKAVAERIFPAIVHLVRNAVDHALEPPDERVARGKPEEGLVRIEASARGNGQLELRVIDDGRGVDAEAVARKLGAEVPATDAALLQLLCRPGLSTREVADTTSGRGMGMDIVRRIVVEQLGGELAMETSPGRGTTFRMRVPLTISIVDAFTFECASQRFVVPLSTVDEILDLDGVRIVQPPGDGALGLLERRGESVPVVHLARVLGLAGGVPAPRPKALVVRRDGQALAFTVDRMLGQQEVVVRPLEDPLLDVEGVAGATDLGDGRATLVVDLLALGARLGRGAAEVLT